MNRNLKQFSLFLIAAIVGSMIGIGIYASIFAGKSRTAQQTDSANVTQFTVDRIALPSFDFTEVADRILPTVVHVKTKFETTQRTLPFDNPFFEFFDPRQFNIPQQGTGSGVIMTKDGYIVTNNHVIANAKEIEVTLHDKRSFTARVIGKDDQTDLALIKIDADDLIYLEAANSDDVRVGEWVLALGNPFNLSSTITAGIVSAKSRSIGILGRGAAVESFIQTDAAVNPGNSGGALVNVEGKLVGINTAIASQTGQYAGYAFAIPSNLVAKVVSDFIKYGRVQRGMLGISIGDVNAEIMKEAGLDRIRGVYVVEVNDDGAAKAAGIKKGDVIIKIGARELNSVPELQEFVSLNRPGDEIEVTVIRNGKERTFNAKLKDMKGNDQIVLDKSDAVKKSIDAELEQLSASELARLGIENGVRVKSVGNGKFKAAGISRNFIITRIDRKRVNTAQDVYDILGAAKEGVLVEGIETDGSKGYYGFGMD